jgi:hypothetical protein
MGYSLSKRLTRHAGEPAKRSLKTIRRALRSRLMTDKPRKSRAIATDDGPQSGSKAAGFA